MKCTKTQIQDLYVVEPSVFEDDRGYFLESFNLEKFQENLFQEGNSEELKKKIEKQLDPKINHKKSNLLEHTIKNYDIRVEAKNHANIYFSIIKKQ